MKIRFLCTRKLDNDWLKNNVNKILNGAFRFATESKKKRRKTGKGKKCKNPLLKISVISVFVCLEETVK